MSNDTASFRREDISAVYGEIPLCVLTLKHESVECHHALSRGYTFGYRGDRSMFSSVFNCIPLTREIHAGPLRDSPELRRLFLRVARERVMNAVGLGSYEIKERDRRFLGFADSWISNNPL